VSESREIARFGGMRLFFVPASHPTADLEIVAAWLGLAVWLGFLFAPLDLVAGFFPECRFRAATGMACMTCGTTRAFLALGDGEFLQAMRMNPLVTLLSLLGLLYVPVAWFVWLARRPRPRLGFTSRRAAWIFAVVAAVLVLVNWSFLIVDGR